MKVAVGLLARVPSVVYGESVFRPAVAGRRPDAEQQTGERGNQHRVRGSVALGRDGEPGPGAAGDGRDDHLGRHRNEYLGQGEMWLRKGHIPGAISFHWARLMEKDHTHKFKPFAQVKAEFEAAGITPDKEIM